MKEPKSIRLFGRNFTSGLLDVPDGVLLSHDAEMLKFNHS